MPLCRFFTQSLLAGLGRAPAVALAYMWWGQGMHLEDAHKLLLSKRPCCPKLSAIREAAADMLYSGDPQEKTIRKAGTSFSKTVEIAGVSAPATHTPVLRVVRCLNLWCRSSSHHSGQSLTAIVGF
jgi:hypothetical protein